MTSEIPQERSDEEAHRTPPGKRPPEAEINSVHTIQGYIGHILG
ncbi:hypothetical protein [Lederbergia panacisoli]|nr:hypothetical protein [Lederbergia panacisoli]MCR2820436.1 hypothetical protein [Lederbergia panacisoli]